MQYYHENFTNVFCLSFIQKTFEATVLNNTNPDVFNACGDLTTNRTFKHREKKYVIENQ